MSNFAISLFYLYVVYECFTLALIVLDHLVFNYLLLLDTLIKKILVYGLGKSGISTYNFLRQKAKVNLFFCAFFLMDMFSQ